MLANRLYGKAAEVTEGAEIVSKSHILDSKDMKEDPNVCLAMQTDLGEEQTYF